MHLVPGAWCLVPGTWYLVPGTSQLVQCPSQKAGHHALNPPTGADRTHLADW